MRTRTILLAAIMLAAGALLGWLATSERLDVPPALAQGSAMGDGPTLNQRARDGKKPNIVFILMDNLGYGEVGCYGGGILRGAPTPRIDKLASEGTRLLNFNVEAQCTPSRSAILTGRFSIRSGTHSVPIGGAHDGLTQWEVTIAELLSSAGYATGHFGKWHLGSDDGRLPNDQGFDEWFGIPRTTDESFWPSSPAAKAAGVEFTHIMEGRKGEKSRKLDVYDLKQRRLIDAEVTRRTIDFMKRSAESGKPFYAYVPFTLVHFPTLPNPTFAGKTGFGDFPDSLAEMDAHVGDILDAIDELRIRNNTIVVFTSDNGPEATWPWQGTSGPWRGYYFTHMEGSLRAPFIIRWPGRIPAGRISNEIVHEVDTFTTFAKIADASVPNNRPIDGVDQTDFLLGKSEKSNREGFPVFVADRLEAVKWEKLESRFLRRAARLVDATRQARRPQGVRSHHRPEGRISSDGATKHLERGARHEDCGGVRAKPEEISSDRARYA
jgi:arylsulfatase